jgi:hypothetical protein
MRKRHPLPNPPPQAGEGARMRRRHASVAKLNPVPVPAGVR